MNIQQELKLMETKALLSSLWIVVLFNILFRDIHELFRPGYIEEIIGGVNNGADVKEETLLIAGILLSFFIAMIVLSRVLPYRWNRLSNMISAVIMIVVTVSTGTRDLDDIWFILVEVLALVLIIGLAWRWSPTEQGFRPAMG